jgi:hypothetical protein
MVKGMLWKILLSGVLMSLGWGIRGQFGGQMGAMVPGAFVGLALATTSDIPELQSRFLSLAAVGAIGIAFGGMMTYGQTLGLVHDRPKSPTRRWGLIGTTLKGSVWIGIGGAFLGMAGGWKLYYPVEVALIMAAMTGFALIGIRLLNRPMNPPERIPRIYFSNPHNKPRTESWGGLWFGYICLVIYLGLLKRDLGALIVSLLGLIGGGIGFTLGEMIQAWGIHSRPFGDRMQGRIDWWKAMEMTFGAIAGIALGAGWQLAQMTQPRIEIGALWEAWNWQIGVSLVISVGWLIFLIEVFRGNKGAIKLMEMPFLWGLVPMSAIFADRLTTWVVAIPSLVLVSAANVARKWSDEGWLHPAVRWLFAVIFTLAIGAIGTPFLVERSQSLLRWGIALIVWPQVILSNLKAATRGNIWRSKASWPVEVTFLALAILITLWVR